MDRYGSVAGAPERPLPGTEFFLARRACTAQSDRPLSPAQQPLELLLRMTAMEHIAAPWPLSRAVAEASGTVVSTTLRRCDFPVRTQPARRSSVPLRP